MAARIVAMDSAAGTAVTNTVTETSAARKIFAANELTAKKVYDFECIVRATATNSTDTLLARVRFGTSATPASNTSCAVNTAVDVANDMFCVVRGRIHVHSATRAVLTAVINDFGADPVAGKVYSEILTIAADTAYYLDVSLVWSVADAGNSAQSEAFTVIEVV